jgi:hypothetical protein
MFAASMTTRLLPSSSYVSPTQLQPSQYQDQSIWSQRVGIDLLFLKGQAIGLIIKVSYLISREDLTFRSSRFSAFAPRTFLFRGFIASDTTPKNYKDLNFESYSSCFLVPIETVRQRRKVSELTNLRLLTPSMKTRHESDYIFNLF